MDNEDTRQELMSEVAFEDLPPICVQAVNILGLEMFVKLSCEIGGTSLYIPKFESVIAKARDRLIVKQFNGSNFRDLALKYNLTEVWVRQIINQDLAKKNQTSLFDEQAM